MSKSAQRRTRVSSRVKLTEFFIKIDDQHRRRDAREVRRAQPVHLSRVTEEEVGGQLSPLLAQDGEGIVP